jgi:hypothetical protein
MCDDCATPRNDICDDCQAASRPLYKPKLADFVDAMGGGGHVCAMVDTDASTADAAPRLVPLALDKLDWRNDLGCTGIGASWCPVCGGCTCQRHDDGELDVRLFREDGTEYDLPYVDRGGARYYPCPNDLRGTGLVRKAVGMDDCPLHAPDSKHAEPA